MLTAAEAARALARRIRDLRKRRWPDRTITQAQLARVLGERKPASVQLISSWEREADPSLPPEDRIGALATFFSTRRSVEGARYRLLDEGDLSEAEAQDRDRLLKELLGLRDAATSPARRTPEQARRSIIGRGPWHFADQGPVTIVCAERPPEPAPGPRSSGGPDPDRSELARFADLDALVELHGHIRAVNPDLEVQYRSADRIRRDDLRGHLVLLGGWNRVTHDTMRLTGVPVRQHPGPEPGRGWFEVGEDGESRQLQAEFEARDSERSLVQDVGHFLRAPNPFNPDTTLTVCNGMYGTGVFGAVRALTDRGFRDRNAAYLAGRFPGERAFSLLFRVHVVNGVVATPAWPAPEVVLHTWPARNGRSHHQEQ